VQRKPSLFLGVPIVHTIGSPGRLTFTSHWSELGHMSFLKSMRERTHCHNTQLCDFISKENRRTDHYPDYPLSWVELPTTVQMTPLVEGPW
jgi:hypothetical protein